MELMKIAVLGTGMVGRAHAGKLVGLGHDVVIGTKDPAKTMAETKPDSMGSPPFSEWHKENSQIRLVSFADAAKHGEVVFEALHGAAVVEVLSSIKADLTHKILIDIANPLDFSKGMPPSLFVSNTDSLGEQVQKALPETKVVKTFNTMAVTLQVNPQMLANGDHNIFVSGNDADAKAEVTKILNSYGWQHVIDLGDITTARGTEMLMPFWLRMWGSLQTPIFNYKIVR
jgi:predicted dinucleotide-binding enzyme